jgi:hypothetical protein
MKNLLTEVSKIKSMMGLTPNINEQTSTMDFYNKYFGSDDKKKEQNLMDKWSSMGKPKEQINNLSNINKDNLDEVIGCSGYGKSTPQFEVAKIMATKEGWKKSDNNGKGSRSYRNNNPGNLDYQESFKSIDKDVTKEIKLDGTIGRFAKFSSPCLGAKALIEQKIIKWAKGNMPDYGSAPNYEAGKIPTLKQFVYTYAPPNENDTTKYIKDILRSLNNPKFNENTLMKDILRF